MTIQFFLRLFPLILFILSLIAQYFSLRYKFLVDDILMVAIVLYSYGIYFYLVLGAMSLIDIRPVFKLLATYLTPIIVFFVLLVLPLKTPWDMLSGGPSKGHGFMDIDMPAAFFMFAPGLIITRQFQENARTQSIINYQSKCEMHLPEMIQAGYDVSKIVGAGFDDAGNSYIALQLTDRVSSIAETKVIRLDAHGKYDKSFVPAEKCVTDFGFMYYIRDFFVLHDGSLLFISTKYRGQSLMTGSYLLASGEDFPIKEQNVKSVALMSYRDNPLDTFKLGPDRMLYMIEGLSDEFRPQLNVAQLDPSGMQRLKTIMNLNEIPQFKSADMISVKNFQISQLGEILISFESRPTKDDYANQKIYFLRADTSGKILELSEAKVHLSYADFLLGDGSCIIIDSGSGSAAGIHFQDKTGEENRAFYENSKASLKTMWIQKFYRDLQGRFIVIGLDRNRVNPLEVLKIVALQTDGKPVVDFNFTY